jgi:hypothetical protein
MRVDIFNTAKKYDIIYADPPWKYNARNNNTKFGKGASGHYSLMSMSDIEIPAEDEAAQKLAADFAQCKKTFLRLCEVNMQFYDLQNRKVRRQGATVKEFKEISLAVSLALNSARRDMNELENQYKEMKGVIKEE